MAIARTAPLDALGAGTVDPLSAFGADTDPSASAFSPLDSTQVGGTDTVAGRNAFPFGDPSGPNQPANLPPSPTQGGGRDIPPPTGGLASGLPPAGSVASAAGPITSTVPAGTISGGVGGDLFPSQGGGRSIPTPPGGGAPGIGDDDDTAGAIGPTTTPVSPAPTQGGGRPIPPPPGGGAPGTVGGTPGASLFPPTPSQGGGRPIPPTVPPNPSQGGGRPIPPNPGPNLIPPGEGGATAGGPFGTSAGNAGGNQIFDQNTLPPGLLQQLMAVIAARQRAG